MAALPLAPRPQHHARAFRPSMAGSRGRRVHWTGARSFMWTIAWCMQVPAKPVIL